MFYRGGGTPPLFFFFFLLCLGNVDGFLQSTVHMNEVPFGKNYQFSDYITIQVTASSVFNHIFLFSYYINSGNEWDRPPKIGQWISRSAPVGGGTAEFHAKRDFLLLFTKNYGGQRPQIGRVIPLYYLCCVNNARKVYYKLYYSSITIYFHLNCRRCGGVMCGGREKGVGGGSQLHNEKIKY